MKKIEFHPPIIQAAMAGISDKEFVQQMLDLGAGMVTLGGYSIDQTTHNATQEIRERGRKETIIPLETEELKRWCKTNLDLDKRDNKQLIALNLRFSSFSQNVEERMKYFSQYVDVIEINAHCRQPEIMIAKAGQYLIEDLNILNSILEHARKKLSSTFLGLKIRGYKIEKKRELVDIIERSKLDYLHIDCMQPGEHKANIKLISEFSKLTDIAIIGNNSVRTMDDVKNMLTAGASAISMARPLISNSYNIKKLIDAFYSEG
ncbi:MAG: tRNA-dihydrouridine synthase [Candidatus Heimdallarchaeaceae archaeon]